MGVAKNAGLRGHHLAGIDMAATEKEHVQQPADAAAGWHTTGMTAHCCLRQVVRYRTIHLNEPGGEAEADGMLKLPALPRLMGSKDCCAGHSPLGMPSLRTRSAVSVKIQCATAADSRRHQQAAKQARRQI